jgi:hypothetical protein
MDPEFCFTNNYCTYFRCKFVHEPDAKESKKCAHGLNCNRQICRFKHPYTPKKTRDECRHKNNCTYPKCVFAHTPPTETAACKLGTDCDRQVCHFIHSEIKNGKINCPRGDYCCYHQNGWCAYYHSKPCMFAKKA